MIRHDQPISVYEKLAIKAGEAQLFEGDAAYLFDQVNPIDTPKLVNSGVIDLKGTTNYNTVVQASFNIYDFAVHNEAGGVIKVTSDVTWASVGVLESSAWINSLENDGLIVARSLHGYAGIGGGDHMTVVNTGSIQVDALQASGIFASGTGDFLNTGVIDIHGVNMAQGVGLEQGDFLNTGEIRVTADQGSSIAVSIAPEMASFTNTGLIAALGQWGGTAVELSSYYNPSEDVLIENSGAMKGQVAFSESYPYGRGGETTLHNEGLMAGRVEMGEGLDILQNESLIRGDVFLGGGSDHYDGTGGRVTGQVYGEAGDDLISGGRAGEYLDGDGGFFLGVSGSDTLQGGGGDDTLVGNYGADVLTGGKGADVFRYANSAQSTGAQPDLITDLGAHDRIDLSAIGITLVDHLDGGAQEMIVAYDPAANVTRLEVDMDGDGVGDGAEDMVIVLNGDHRGFDGFVL